MNGLLRAGFLLCCGLAAAEPCPAGQALPCPAKVRLASGAVMPEDVPPGYKPIVSSSIVRLTGVGVFDGPPEEGAALKPASVLAGGAAIKWVFDDATKPRVWTSCDYANGLVRLARQPGGPVSACTASVKKAGPQKSLEAAFSCE